MYNPLVSPHFIYCSNVWNDGNRTHIEKLYKMQKKAAHVITGSNYEIRSSEIFQRSGRELIEDTLKKRVSLTVFKALKGDLPENISENLKFEHNKQHQLRSNDCKIYLQKPKTDFIKKSFSYRGALTWNSLPSEVVNNYVINYN